MALRIRVVLKASRKAIKQEGSYLKAYLTKPAEGGLANAQLIELLAEYLGVKKYQLRIIWGEKSRDKLVEINA